MKLVLKIKGAFNQETKDFESNSETLFLIERAFNRQIDLEKENNKFESKEFDLFAFGKDNTAFENWEAQIRHSVAQRGFSKTKIGPIAELHTPNNYVKYNSEENIILIYSK